MIKTNQISEISKYVRTSKKIYTHKNYDKGEESSRVHPNFNNITKFLDTIAAAPRPHASAALGQQKSLTTS